MGMGCPLAENLLCCRETAFQVSALSDKLTVKTFLLPGGFLLPSWGKREKKLR